MCKLEIIHFKAALTRATEYNSYLHWGGDRKRVRSSSFFLKPDDADAIVIVVVANDDDNGSNHMTLSKTMWGIFQKFRENIIFLISFDLNRAHPPPPPTAALIHGDSTISTKPQFRVRVHTRPRTFVFPFQRVNFHFLRFYFLHNQICTPS